MRTHSRIVLLVLITSLVCSCNTFNPRIKEDARQASIAEMTNKKACCASFQAIQYEHVTLPFARFATITPQSPVYSFNGFNSYFKAYQLPSSGKPLKWSFLSMDIGTIQEKNAIFNPVILYLDKNHKIIKKVNRLDHGHVRWGTFSYGFGFRLDVTLPDNTKYILIHTTRNNLTGVLPFYRSANYKYPLHDKKLIKWKKDLMRNRYSRMGLARDYSKFSPFGRFRIKFYY